MNKKSKLSIRTRIKTYRTQNKLKYMAGCELGAGTFINDTLPEEKATKLRKLK